MSHLKPTPTLLALLLCACAAEAELPCSEAADRVCPALPPYPGAPCEGVLSCPYTTVLGEGTFTCEGGQWEGEIACPGCAPPLAESCAGPFDGSAPASVELGAASGPFAPFEDGEHVAIEWGAQGFAMIGLRLRVGGDAPPSCVRATTRVRLDGGEWVQTQRPVALHCGRSLSVLEILPDLPCSSREYTVDVEVDVEGVGTSDAHLVVQGGMCPRPLG